MRIDTRRLVEFVNSANTPAREILLEALIDIYGFRGVVEAMSRIASEKADYIGRKHRDFVAEERLNRIGERLEHLATEL